MQKPYYKKTNFTLYQADTLKFLKEIPENSVGMIFADPPYFLSSGSFSCQNGKMVSVKKGDWDLSNGTKKNFKFHNEWIKESRRVLKPNGTIWISGTYHSIYQCGFALEINKFHFLNDIAWLKPNASPNLSCRFFTASHETLIWARKEKKGKHTFNYKTMVEWENNYQKEIKCSHCGKKDRYEILHKKEKQMRSVWAINTPQRIEKTFGKHPTQKSAELLKRVVLASTNKGDVILDPFTGSSTTGLAAYLFGRNFIGIDNEKKYLDLSIKRFEELDKNMKNKFSKK
jgi:site-specific DNA-methyltransferase (adenine-specific)